jgi:hypothetical protein
VLFRLRHLRFLPTPAAACLLDYALTLHGQPAAYWRGDTTAVNELSPDVRRLLEIGLAASVAGFVIWVGAIAGLLVLLPRPVALFLALVVTIGHVVGGTTWLWRWPTHGYQIGIGLCVVAAFGLAATIWWEETGRPPPDGRGDRWARVRWPLIGLLAVGPVYAFLWPH